MSSACSLLLSILFTPETNSAREVLLFGLNVPSGYPDNQPLCAAAIISFSAQLPAMSENAILLAGLVILDVLNLNNSEPNSALVITCPGLKVPSG